MCLQVLQLDSAFSRGSNQLCIVSAGIVCLWLCYKITINESVYNNNI